MVAVESSARIRAFPRGDTRHLLLSKLNFARGCGCVTTFRSYTYQKVATYVCARVRVCVCVCVDRHTGTKDMYVIPTRAKGSER